jgi:integrase
LDAWSISWRILWRIRVSDYPATTLALNKGKYYVLLTIPAELREFFNGRKQLKRSTGTSDLADAKRRQHNISAELYAQLDSCKPDLRDVISNHLGWIGDAEEVQRLEDEGHLEGIIMANMYAEDTHDPERDKDESCIDLVHAGGEKALEVYRQWKAEQESGLQAPGAMSFSIASEQYLATKLYGPAKTMRDAELSLQEFLEFAGDIALEDVTPVMVHEYAEFVGATKSRETVAKKIGYVKRMYDHAVRKGWVPSNIFLSVKLNKNVGRKRESYEPFLDGELLRLFGQVMPDHIRELLSVLVTTGMRLDEAALLNWEDIKEDAGQGVTYFDLTAAIVKNRGSQRRVPVHSKLDWVVTGRTGQMFPQFTRDRDGKAQASASKALMPLIRKVTDDRKKVVHSLRGNFKDMLRDAGVSKEVNDFITGHASGDVAGNYGSGPSLKVRQEAMERLSFDFI